MLHKIGMSGTFLLYIIYEAMHSTALMVSREDESLGNLFIKFLFGGIIFLLAVHLYGHEVLQHVEQGIAAQHFFPHIGGAVTGFRLYADVLIRLVERKETCVLTVEPCGHKHLFGAYGKVDEATFELQKLLAFYGSGGHVLLDGIVMCLPGEGVLQLDGHHGEAIHEDSEVNFVVVCL